MCDLLFVIGLPILATACGCGCQLRVAGGNCACCVLWYATLLLRGVKRTYSLWAPIEEPSSNSLACRIKSLLWGSPKCLLPHNVALLCCQLARQHEASSQLAMKILLSWPIIYSMPCALAAFGLLTLCFCCHLPFVKYFG